MNSIIAKKINILTQLVPQLFSGKSSNFIYRRIEENDLYKSIIFDYENFIKELNDEVIFVGYSPVKLSVKCNNVVVFDLSDNDKIDLINTQATVDKYEELVQKQSDIVYEKILEEFGSKRITHFAGQTLFVDDNFYFIYGYHCEDLK